MGTDVVEGVTSGQVAGSYSPPAGGGSDDSIKVDSPHQVGDTPDNLEVVENAPRTRWYGSSVKDAVVNFVSRVWNGLKSFFSSLFSWGSEKWYGKQYPGSGDNYDNSYKG